MMTLAQQGASVSGWTIAIAAAGWIVAVIIAVGQIVVLRKFKQIDDLKVDVRRFAEQLVDTRFTASRTELVGMIELLRASEQRIRERLADGDKLLDRLSRADQQIELKTVQAIEQLHRTLIERTATKEELLRLEQQIAQTRLDCAKCHAANRGGQS